MSLLQNSNAIQTAAGAYDINNSLRLRKSATGYLNRTFATPTSSTTWTVSLWFKRGEISSAHSHLFTTSVTDNFIRFQTSTDILQYSWANGSTVQSTAVFRDPSAWYHLVIAVNTTQATSSNRIRIYINGSEIAYGTSTYPALNATTLFNTARAHYLSFTSNQFDGYVAEVNWIDGQQLTPTSFGETDTTTGVWKPKAYTGTYGTNGFYQKYSDPSVFPILVNKTVTSQSNANQDTITVNVPSGVNNGDLLILVLSGGNSTVYTTPAGWTLWFTTTNTTAIFYRTASSEPASYTVTGSTNTTAIGFMLAYRNAAIDVMGTISATTASPIVAPAITTTASNTIVVAFMRNNAVSNVFSTPSGFTPLISESDTSDPSGAIFTKTQAAAGSSGTASSTPTITPGGAAGTVGRGIQFSIKPISNTNLGLDSSGNGNHWTTNNISVTSGATYDAMTDSPTLTSATVANYPVINPLYVTASTQVPIINGNLTANNSGAASSAGGVCSFPVDNGKWYWEVNVQTLGATMQIGVVPTGHQTSLGKSNAGIYAYHSSGTKYVNGVSSAYGASYTAGDVIGMTYDSTTGVLTAYKNNVSQGTLTTLSTTSSFTPYLGFDNGGAQLAHINFGQRPFAYTPPAGFNRLNTFNLPTSTIKKGNSYMDATTYTGTGATLSVTNPGAFRPDLVWIKIRNVAGPHLVIDAVRGVTERLSTNAASSDSTDANGLSSFNSNGFTLGSNTNYNANGSTFVAWQWQAGSSTVTDTTGTISSQVRANTTTGFSIATYAGTGANGTVGHGLGVAPKLVIVKKYNGAGENWIVWHTSLANTQYLSLNATDASVTDSTIWNSTSPTSTVISLGTNNKVNRLGSDTYVVYCWAEIAGFSKFSSYTGNGSTNGPFVYTGFRPKFIIIKNITTSGTSWKIADSSRSTINVAAQDLEANSDNAEVTGTSTNNLFIDLLSNGFKVRGSASSLNTSGNTIIYMAFAENPFKNSLAR